MENVEPILVTEFTRDARLLIARGRVRNENRNGKVSQNPKFIFHTRSMHGNRYNHKQVYKTINNNFILPFF